MSGCPEFPSCFWAACAALTAYYMESIEQAWIYLIDLTAGMAIIWALKWYWWRVNAWAEISAMICSLILANGWLILNGLEYIGLLSEPGFQFYNTIYTDDFNMIRAVIILIITTIVWVLVALITKPVDSEVLDRFYKLVRPSGWWGPVAKRHPEIKTDLPIGRRWGGWILGVGFIYCSLLGIGYLVTARYILGTGLLLITLLILYFLIKKFDINSKGL